MDYGYQDPTDSHPIDGSQALAWLPDVVSDSKAASGELFAADKIDETITSNVGNLRQIAVTSNVGNLRQPAGPDYAEVAARAAASRAESASARVRWRRANLDVDEMDPAAREELLSGTRPLRVATPETLSDYSARGNGLLARYRHELDLSIPPEDIDPRQFVNWLLSLRPVLSVNTWRLYRRSANAVITCMPTIYIDQAIGVLFADHQVGRDEGRSPRKVKGGPDAVGASLRAKRIDEDHFRKIKRAIRKLSKSQVVNWLSDWMDAGVSTGLRPSEWATAAVERRPDASCRHGERIWLHVINAKACEGRPAHRTLDMSDFSSETLRAVERVTRLTHDWVLSGRYAQRQSAVAALFHETCATLFPRMRLHYTLYSLRHQFIANMKTIYSREEIAAMAGHIDIDTQTEHYGKRRSAWSTVADVPAPIPEQVAYVRQRLEMADERLEFLSLRDEKRQRKLSATAAQEVAAVPAEDEHDPGDAPNL